MYRYTLFVCTWQEIMSLCEIFLQSDFKKGIQFASFQNKLVGRLRARPWLTRCRGSVALTLNVKEAGKGGVHLPDDVIETGRERRREGEGEGREREGGGKRERIWYVIL